jgi:adenylosuccinate synthase
MKINLIVDLQYGSTGKGLLCGYLAQTTWPDVVTTCNMPNAGHTYIDDQGQVMIHKVLPNGIVSPSLQYVLIGPGAVISLDQLQKEINQAREFGYMMTRGIEGNFEPIPVILHPGVTFLQEQHRNVELEMLNGIASTMQGSMAAMVHKMGRDPKDNPTASKYIGESIPGYDGCIRVCSHEDWMWIIDNASLIQAEGSQGFSLGINQKFYPYCTSRECTPHRLLSDMGLPYAPKDTVVYGTLRTYPIRVGNTVGGFSGDCYSDQVELTWEDLGLEPEKTTVTQRIRRIFSFSRHQLNDALWACRPDYLFLNFCNYMDEVSLGGLVDRIDKSASKYGSKLVLLGYGPAYEHVKEYHNGNS